MTGTIRLLSSVVVVFLLLQYVTSMPTSSETGNESIYLIKAHTHVGNTLNSDITSEWFFEGKLNIQSFTNYSVMKLTRVKSGSYNGPNNPTLSQQPSFETENGLQLSQPFVVYYNGSLMNELGFSPKDPIWSTNIKKAIATVFQYDLIALTDGADEIITEKTIHGICDVHYIRDDILVKEFKHCRRNETQNEKENKFGNKHYQQKTLRTYILNENFIPTSIQSSSTHIVKEHVDDDFEQQVRQSIRFESKLIGQPIQTPTDIEDCTVKKQPQYEYEVPVPTETTNETINYFKKQIEHLERQMTLNSTENTDKTFQTIGNIHHILKKIDLPTLKSFLKSEDDLFTSRIVSSMLPFIGSNNSVQLIKELFLQNKLRNLTDLLTLVKYPIYVEDISEDLIQDLSELLDFENNTIPNDKMKAEDNVIALIAYNNYILGFSNFVRGMYSPIVNNTRDYIIQTYVDKYCKMYSDPKYHQSQMSLILGLGNMGELATDCLLNIVKNNTESRHLRTRAMYNIENTLQSKNGTFTSIWPIVQNASNPYEVRVAALSVLLHKEVEHPETIYQYLKNIPDDAESQHIYHYFYTFMQSSKNLDNGEVVDDFKMNPPISTRGILTGFYHLRSQDSKSNNKFMSILNLHVIAEPTTNTIRSVHVSFEHKQKQKHSRYTAVIKLEGRRMYNWRRYYHPYEPTQEVQDMVKENKLKNNYVRENEYFEIIVYDEEHRPLFAIDSNSYRTRYYRNLPPHFIEQQIHNLINTDHITSEEDRSIVASDLGTEIAIIIRNERMYHGFSNILDELKNIFYKPTHFFKVELKSLDRQKVDLESVNPVLDINHGVTRFSTKQYMLNFSPVVNFTRSDPFIKWNDKDLLYENLYEYKHAVYVGYDPIVSKYCKDCTHVEFYKLPEDKNTHIHFEINLGAKVLDVLALECSLNDPMSEFVPTMLNKFWIKNKQLPVLQPLMFLKYIQDYVQFNSMYDICSFSVSSQTSNEEKIPYWTVNGEVQLRAVLSPNQYKTKVQFSSERDNVTVSLSNLRQSDDTLINLYNVTLHGKRREKNVNLTFVSDNTKEIIKMELGVAYKSEQHSSWQNSLFCSEFPEPTLFNVQVKYRHSDENENFAFDVSNIFSVSEYRKRLLSENKHISNCLKENTTIFNLKTLRGNFPPTEECYEACLYMSSYDNFTTNIEFKEYSPSSSFGILLNSVVVAPFENQDKLTEDNNDNIIERLAHKLDNPFKKPDINIKVQQLSLIHVQSNPLILNVNNGELNTTIEIPQEFEPEVLPRPLERLWSDFKFANLGWESVCIITPNYVKTFTENTIDFPSVQRLKTNLAIIDCDYNPAIGILFSRNENNSMEFKLWTDKRIVFSNNGVYKYHNGTTLESTQNYAYKVEHLGDQRLYISTGYFDFYYNMDYIAIKLESTEIDKFCGLCSTGVFTATNKYSINN